MRKFAFGIGLLVFSAMLSVQAYAAGSSHAEYVKKYEGPPAALPPLVMKGREGGRGEPALPAAGGPAISGRLGGRQARRNDGVVLSASNTVVGITGLGSSNPRMLEAGAARWLRTVSRRTRRKAQSRRKLTEADYNNIDCLLCTLRIQADGGEGGGQAPDRAGPSIDVLKAAQSVQNPTNDMCLRCHMAPAGGRTTSTASPDDGQRRPRCEGDAVPRLPYCKETQGRRRVRHQGQELLDVKVACENCHASPHKGKNAKIMDRHTARIACQTCHIPTIAGTPRCPRSLRATGPFPC